MMQRTNHRVFTIHSSHLHQNQENIWCMMMMNVWEFFADGWVMGKFQM